MDGGAHRRDQRGARAQLVDTGAKTVAIACPFCMTMLTDGLKSTGRDMRVVDVATLLAEAIED